MAGRYKAYSEYKDSGITWTGQVPSHWSLVRFKHVLAEKKKTSNPSLPAGSISFGEVIYKSDETISPETKASYQEVLKGEFLVNPLNMNYDLLSLRTALSSIDVVVSTGYIVLRSNARLNPRYARWLLQEFDVAHMKTLGSGVRQTINYTDIGNSFFFEVPESEQKQIARFLDHETGKIDALIEKQQALIALLQEKRQAVISHAVTKGLNQEARMKDSGVEWLDSLPSHWDLIKMSYILKLQSGDGITSSNIEAVGDYPVYGGNGQRGFTSTYNCEGKYVLIGRQGALCGNVNLAENKFFASEHAVVVYPRISFDTVYLAEMLRFLDLGQYSVSAAQPGVSVERLNMLKVICPPLDEQRCIAKFVTDEIVKFDELSEHSENAITLLQERRTALISAAVTGKIDVRDWEPVSEA